MPAMKRVGILCRVIAMLCLSLIGFGQSPAPQVSLEHQVSNIAAFARLYGLVRWFHPSDESADANWDTLTHSGLNAIRYAIDGPDLVERLEAFFAPVAPTIRVFLSVTPDAIPADLQQPESDSIVFVCQWEHKSVGTAWSDNVMGGLYYSKRIRGMMSSSGRVMSGLHTPQDPLLVDLAKNVQAWLPISLYADRFGTFPQDSADTQNGSSTEILTNPTSSWLADAVVVWNVMQHFYPYFDVADVDWHAILESTLRNILMQEEAYTAETLEADLLVPLQDGHAWIDPSPSSSPGAIPDLKLVKLDGLLVVSHSGANSSAAGIRLGDVIRTVDGIPAAAAFEEAMTHLSGSQQLRERLACQLVLSGEEGSMSALVVESAADSSELACEVERTESHRFASSAIDVVVEIEPGIFYLDATRATDAELKAAFPQLAAASGIVVDARGYIVTTWAPYVMSRSLHSMRLRIPVTTVPNRMDVRLRTASTELQPFGRFSSDTELVFLIDARAVSAAEHQLSYFIRAGIGTTVGMPTAGANGNVNRLVLPSGQRLTWTGMIADWSDDLTFHAVGIQPDIRVQPTRQGIANGVDEQLEVALELLRKARER